MKGKYSLTMPDDLIELEDNYNAFNKLMGMFEFSGVFSEKMIGRVYSLSCAALDAKINQYKGLASNEYIEACQDKLYADFKQLFEVYSVFSVEFVAACKCEFLILSRYTKSN